MNNNRSDTHLHFNFGNYQTSAHIMSVLPDIDSIAQDFGNTFFKPLLICDNNTRQFAEKIRGNTNTDICIIESGEQHKNWQSAETILHCAFSNGMGRDGTFIGVGGGVICDLASFAASVYMRGCRLSLIPTSLLSMADAGIGGKTGFDLFGKKNLAGTFYPARHVYISMESLYSLPMHEWKSGMAEIIKSAVLCNNDFLSELADIAAFFPEGSFSNGFPCEFKIKMLNNYLDTFLKFIGFAIQLKGSIAEEDPLETGNRRILLNLGHTFAHALESSAGLGRITHGEAVAWGIARSCDLGLAAGICPKERANKILSLLKVFGYEISAPHPLAGNTELLMQALNHDKKKQSGNYIFIVPGESSAVPVFTISPDTVKNILNGVKSF